MIAIKIISVIRVSQPITITVSNSNTRSVLFVTILDAVTILISIGVISIISITKTILITIRNSHTPSSLITIKHTIIILIAIKISSVIRVSQPITITVSNRDTRSVLFVTVLDAVIVLIRIEVVGVEVISETIGVTVSNSHAPSSLITIKHTIIITVGVRDAALCFFGSIKYTVVVAVVGVFAAFDLADIWDAVTIGVSGRMVGILPVWDAIVILV